MIYKLMYITEKCDDSKIDVFDEGCNIFICEISDEKINPYVLSICKLCDELMEYDLMCVPSNNYTMINVYDISKNKLIYVIDIILFKKCSKN